MVEDTKTTENSIKRRNFNTLEAEPVCQKFFEQSEKKDFAETHLLTDDLNPI